MSDWDWWAQRLAGAAVANADAPRPGFFRQSHKAFYGARKTFMPVCFYPHPDTGELRCRIGDEDIAGNSVKALETWNRVNSNPVSEEAYRAVAQDGQPWPDEHELVPMGDNQPPEPETFEDLRDAIDDLWREANKRLDGPPIADQEEADRVGNLSDRLAELHKRCELLKKEERRPHDSALKTIQKRWAILLMRAETYTNLKYKLLTPWLLKQQKEIEEAKAAELQAGEVPAETQRPRAGTRGRAISLKTTKRAEIYDYAATLKFFADSQDVRVCVQDLANRAVRAGATVPGCNTIEETKAV